MGSLVLEDLRGAIDTLVADGADLANEIVLLELLGHLRRLEAVATRAVGDFDASGQWGNTRARSCTQWLRSRTHDPRPTTARRVFLASRLRHLPLVLDAWLAGDIGEHHAHLIARCWMPTTADALVRDQNELLDAARTLWYEGFSRVVAYWLRRADPDLADGTDRDKHDRRRVHLSQSLGDMWYLDGLLDPLSGEIIRNELKRLEDQMFAADWAEARARLGRDPRTSELARTPEQRRADALVEMAKRSRTAPADGKRPAPLLTVLVGLDELSAALCELLNGCVLSRALLKELLLDDPHFERIIFESPSRVIDVSERQRLFTGALRRAIQIRDRECFHPDCDVGVDDCEIDHIQPWSWGGPTTQDNGRLACATHNRSRHHH